MLTEDENNSSGNVRPTLQRSQISRFTLVCYVNVWGKGREFVYEDFSKHEVLFTLKGNVSSAGSINKYTSNTRLVNKSPNCDHVF